ncbi:alpha/beta fold hydrolase [Nonomuraea angiospora]|uniref:alpha/beta fold hydrolase n=1 Tax=Nonomuraea angiospora TaxID=46172 RepID=UPI0033D230D9
MTAGHAGQLAFERREEGPPVVLSHGIGHDRHGWDPVTDRLAPHHELVLVDLPGHGGSPLSHGGGPLGVIELTDRVERLLDDLHLASPLIAGNSLGGAIALELAPGTGCSSAARRACGPAQVRVGGGRAVRPRAGRCQPRR